MYLSLIMVGLVLLVLGAMLGLTVGGEGSLNIMFSFIVLIGLVLVGAVLTVLGLLV